MPPLDRNRLSGDGVTNSLYSDFDLVSFKDPSSLSNHMLVQLVLSTCLFAETARWEGGDLAPSFSRCSDHRLRPRSHSFFRCHVQRFFAQCQSSSCPLSCTSSPRWSMSLLCCAMGLCRGSPSTVMTSPFSRAGYDVSVFMQRRYVTASMTFSV